MLEAESALVTSGCPEELLYAESLEGLKGRLDTWKRQLDSEGLRINVKMTKMMISNKNAGKVTKVAKFPCVVSRNGSGGNFILYQFIRYIILEVKGKRIATLNVNNGQISKQT